MPAAPELALKTEPTLSPAYRVIAIETLLRLGPAVDADRLETDRSQTDRVEKTTDIYRALAKDWPDAFLPDLAMSLNDYRLKAVDSARD